MKLETYLTNSGLTREAFARRCGVTPSAVTKWVTGRTRPDWAQLRAIWRATDGAVAPNDFLAPPPHGRAAESPLAGAEAVS